MKKLLNNYAVRVLAFLLFLALGLVAVLCALGLIYDIQTDTGPAYGPRNFAGSELASTYADTQVWMALIDAYNADLNGTETQPAPEGRFDGGFGYVIRDPEGKIVMDAHRPGSTRITAGSWEREGYLAECYVNLPTTPDTRLYDFVYLYDFLYDGWRVFLPLGLGTGAAALLLLVFLLAAAGRTAEGVKLGGLHRWPLEIYLGGLLTAGGFCLFVFMEGVNSTISRFSHLFYSLLFSSAGALGVGAAAMLGLMTLAARFKVPGWWRNTVIFFCLKWGLRLVVWTWNLFRKLAVWTWNLFKKLICKCWAALKKVLLWLGRSVPKSWKWLWGHVSGAVGGLFHGFSGLIRSLPLAWKGVGVYCLFTLVNILLAYAFSGSMNAFLPCLLFLIDAAGVLGVVWVAGQLKKLQEAGRALAAGDLNHTVDTERMLPSLKEHGENLNAVGVGMTRAVDERMKSERFKTELITNVSHDLKTPLTSIVSYVDLLKKEDIDNERAKEYIEVLDRQSQRLKKLTTDLVDASKASSGALAVNFEQVDLGEMVRQSAGEYAGRFAAAGLEPVATVPEGEWVVRADGRLLWRVLDNLLSNAVKYAMPGTRVYLTVDAQEGKTVLAVKNISRDALNIPAEELLERFVRGDASRSTDGSGLGLSIAQSLMELMGGKLRLTLDGDLFKAELIF